MLSFNKVFHGWALNCLCHQDFWDTSLFLSFTGPQHWTIYYKQVKLVQFSKTDGYTGFGKKNLHCVIKLLRQQCNQIWQRKLRNEIEMNPLLPACNTHCFSHEKDLSKVYQLMVALLTFSLVIRKLHYFYNHLGFLFLL